jgi:hypothetical protein
VTFPSDSVNHSHDQASDNKPQASSTPQWQAEFQALNQTGAKVRAETSHSEANHTASADSSSAVPSYNHDGFVSAMLENAAFQGQQAVKGVAQIVDLSGTKTADHINYFAKPQATEYKSTEWYGEQFGGAIGKFAPFVAAFAVTRGASAKLGLTTALEGAGEGALLSRNSAILTGQAAIAGFGSEAIFTPNEGKPATFSQFVSERAKNGAVGAIDMAALTAGSLSIKTLAASAAKDAPLGSAILRNGAVSSAAAGIPAGMIGAEAHARIFEGRGSTADEREQSALSMAVVGFGLRAVHEARYNTNPAKAPGIAEALNDKINAGMAHVQDMAASLNNPFLASGNRLAFAEAGAGRPLRSMAMESTMRDLRSNVMFRDGDAAAENSQRSQPRSSRGRSAIESKVDKAPDAANDRDTAAKGEGTEKTVALKKALADLHLSEVADFVGKDKVLKEQKVVRSLGSGNDSPAVLELAPSKAFPEGGALKVTIAEGGWQREWGKRPFDAALLTKVHEVDLDGSHFSGSANVYVQELMDTASRYPQDLVDQFFAKLQDSGLEFGDPGADAAKQLGISRKTGELGLLDYPSVDKSGAHETLQAIIQGHEGVEAEYERENQAIRNGNNHEAADVEKADFETIIDADKEAKAQDSLRSGKFTADEKDILSQLKSGDVERKDVLTYAAVVGGHFKPDGSLDMKAATNYLDSLMRRGREAGILEKPGKKSKPVVEDDDY